MVCEPWRYCWNQGGQIVLILVLMEDGLREEKDNVLEETLRTVLILVLMEDGLRVLYATNANCTGSHKS